jgi:hypothetical protein
VASELAVMLETKADRGSGEPLCFARVSSNAFAFLGERRRCRMKVFTTFE